MKKNLFDDTVETEITQNPVSMPIYIATATNDAMYSDNEGGNIHTSTSPSTGASYLRNDMDWEFKLFSDAAMRTEDIKKILQWYG